MKVVKSKSIIAIGSSHGMNHNFSELPADFTTFILGEQIPHVVEVQN